MGIEEFDTIPIAELRRRVDRGIALLRELRRALSVHAGMTLENAPGPIPELDLAKGMAEVQEVMATLPILQEPLSPEERARLRPIRPGQEEQQKEVLDEIIANKEVFEQLAEASDGALPPYEHYVRLREGCDKSELLDAFQRELAAFAEEMRAFQRRLQERLDADVRRMAAT